MIDFERIFEGAPVPGWLLHFGADPDEAVEDLLVGRALLEDLGVAEPAELLLDWLEGLGAQPEFVAATDQALARWIDRSWGVPALPSALGSAVLTGVAWCRAAEVIAADPRLTLAARRLRVHLLSDRTFLAGLSEARARDPLGRAWLALARHQEDRGLIDEWWRLCSLPPEEPWYRGVYGIHGLRGLPPEGDGAREEIPQQVAEGLARLAAALARRAEEGWLDPGAAAEEFLRTARLTMAAYPGPERWIPFWEHALAVRRWTDLAARWIRDLFPGRLKGESRFTRPGGTPWLEPDPGWAAEAREIASRLARRERDAVPAAQNLLDRQTGFARATGDSEFVVKSACHFAARVRQWTPELALKWASLARSFDSWTDYAWNITTTTLLSLGRLEEARKTALEAVQRFPNDQVAANNLAAVLAAQGFLEEAEEIYRKAIERFSRDAYSRNALAQLLEGQGRIRDAERLCREAITLEPENVVHLSALARLLSGQRRFDEAETIYQQVLALDPEDQYALTQQAEILALQGHKAEAELAFRNLIQRFPRDVVPRNSLARLLTAWGRVPEAEALYREVLALDPRDSFAREGLARLAAMGSAEPPDAPSEGSTADRPDRLAGKPDLEKETGPAEIRPGPDRPELATPPGDSDGSGQPEAAESRQLAWQGEVREPVARYGAAAGPAHAGAPAAQALSPAEIETLVQDAYFLRRWARHTGTGLAATTPGELRDRARHLLERLEEAARTSARAAGELGLLATAEGELEEAVSLLREAVQRFPASARLQYAFARAQRELARREQRRLDPASPEQLVKPWRRLGQLDARHYPVQLLGEGRAWLAQVDGRTVEEGAAGAFVKLDRWIQTRIVAPQDLDGEGRDPAALRGSFQLVHEDSFQDWWAREVQIHLFGAQAVSRQDDLRDLAPIRGSLLQFAEALDALEEDWIRRLDLAPAF